jgi:hypothetical protein
MQSSYVTSLIFLLVSFLTNVWFPSSFWFGNSLAAHLAIDKEREQGYSLPEQEHKEMDRPPGMVADLRIQGQQVHSYKK